MAKLQTKVRIIVITKNEIKLINSLSRKKNRKELGLFVVEGEKIVEELLNSNLEIEKIFATEDWNNSADHEKVSPKELERISHLKSANKVLALVKTPETLNWNKKTSLVIDGVNDPGNLGTIIRTADWFGIDQVICSENSVDCYNPKTVMSSMGSIFRVKVIYRDLQEFIKNSNLPVYGALLNGKSIYQTDFEKDVLILMGSESHGISENLIPLVNYNTTIPGSGRAESLNLGTSTAIFCSAYFSQHKSNLVGYENNA